MITNSFPHFVPPIKPSMLPSLAKLRTLELVMLKFAMVMMMAVVSITMRTVRAMKRICGLHDESLPTSSAAASGKKCYPFHLMKRDRLLEDNHHAEDKHVADIHHEKNIHHADTLQEEGKGMRTLRVEDSVHHQQNERRALCPRYDYYRIRCP
ncbi:hypothetical protein Tco_1216315 [Tanacetum coccineum]